jgi:hypothetical protein
MQSTQSINVMVAGVYTVTVTAAAGCSATASQMVSLNNVLITGICPIPAPVNALAGACQAPVSWLPPVFSDNCAAGGNFTLTSTHSPGSFFSVGTTQVTYTATNVLSNTGTCSFNVTVQDNQPPVAACRPVNATLNAQSTATVTAAQVDNGSTDNCAFSAFAERTGRLVVLIWGQMWSR